MGGVFFFLMSEPDEHMSIAHDCLSETQALLDAGHFSGSVSRTYYAAFGAACAALACLNVEIPKGHGPLINSFSEQLIKSGRLGSKFGKVLPYLQAKRLDSDYSIEQLRAITIEDAQSCHQRAAEFVEVVQIEIDRRS